MPTISHISNFFGIPENSITNFIVNGANVEMHVEAAWGSPSFTPQNNDITYFIYTGPGVIQTGNAGMCNWNNCFAFYTLNGVQRTGSNTVGFPTGFRSWRYYRWKRIGNLPASIFRYSPVNSRIYIPETPVRNTSGNDGAVSYISSGSRTIYTNQANETNNAGNPDGDIAYYLSRNGGSVSYIYNDSLPNAITDLSASNTTANGFDLNFTPPSEVNPIEFYEVWINDGNEKWHPYHPAGEVLISGETFTNHISSGKTYKVKLAICDIYWNGSGMDEIESRRAFSNEIEITTL
ncbi:MULTISPECIES: hypothetical protein [Bizionia]|uniref:Fibronectin type-III domain-containing protein n=1 Tax=Bizionia algoritergicola TaxID=291187 RepID=A0A5D0QZC3_9FLAO|nr:MULTISPECIES: hypothetical protein [Bizionia]TYB74602.1 hypothetical protein ES675_00210 [Bizionia algoritergicola]